MSEKTEKPTPRKLRDAKKEGQVTRSEILTNTVVFSVLLTLLFFGGAWMAEYLVGILSAATSVMNLPFDVAIRVLGKALFMTFWLIVGAFLLLSILTSIFIQLVQIGPSFSAKLVTPSLKKLNVKSNIGEIFSANTLAEIVRMVISACILFLVVWTVVKGNLSLVLSLLWGGVPDIVTVTSKLLFQIVLMIFFIFAILAILDWFWQHHRTIKKLMMKREEVKKDHKEDQGDPEMKNRRTDLFKDILFGTDNVVKQSTVVVKNPTHFAVALFYDPNITPLPVVVAKGKDSAAMAILLVAEREKVPIIQHIPVARALYHTVDTDTYIPMELIKQVAAIIAVAQQLKQMNSSEVVRMDLDDDDADHVQ
ncbi:EscU/YscU/HrcU family type III secretion system export apparatus switch protein [Glaciimonas sp. GG7]